jgi:hypothetical protein
MVTLFFACSKDNGGDPPADENVSLNFSSRIDAPQTRSIADNAWDGGEQVQVSVNDETATAYAAAVNGTLTPVSPTYWQSASQSVSARAWSPASWTMQTDQSTEANFRKADFIFAPAVAGITAANSADKPLVFAHRTAKVTVILFAGEGISAEVLNAATVTFFGYTAGTANTDNGSIAGSANGRITAFRNGAAHTALLIPQNMTADADFIGVAANGNNYFHKPAEGEANLEAGKSYTYNVTLGSDGIAVTAIAGAISLRSGTETLQTIFADQTEAASIDMTTTAAWTATVRELSEEEAATVRATTDNVTPEWISINPTSGDNAGDYSINVNLMPNSSGADRFAVIEIECEGEKTEIRIKQTNIKQDGNPYETPEYDMYIIGENGYNLSGNYTAGYWKNGVWKKMENTRYVTEIIANGNDLYMATGDPRGYYHVWKNGANMPTEYDYALKIAVAGNDIYAYDSRSYKSSPLSYTKNGETVTLPFPSYTDDSGDYTYPETNLSFYGFKDIAADGNDVVIAGRDHYWKNGVSRVAGERAYRDNSYYGTSSVNHLGGDMLLKNFTSHIYGSPFDSHNITTGYNWSGGMYGYFNKIIVSNGNVYILPDKTYTYYYQFQNTSETDNWESCYLAYWKNDGAGDHIVHVESLEAPYYLFQHRTDNNIGWWNSKRIEEDAKTGYISDIFVANDNVYIAGTLIQDGIPNAVYWKNGVKTVLPKQEYKYAIADVIYVFNDDVFVMGKLGSGSGTDDKDVVWKNGEIIFEDNDDYDVRYFGIAILPHDPARTW